MAEIINSHHFEEESRYFSRTPKMGMVFSDFPWLFVDIVR